MHSRDWGSHFVKFDRCRFTGFWDIMVGNEQTDAQANNLSRLFFFFIFFFAAKRLFWLFQRQRLLKTNSYKTKVISYQITNKQWEVMRSNNLTSHSCSTSAVRKRHLFFSSPGHKVCTAFLSFPSRILCSVLNACSSCWYHHFWKNPGSMYFLFVRGYVLPAIR